MIESISCWLTPTVLFCVLNLMIGTILITSTFKNNDKKQEEEEGEDHSTNNLPRTPSLLQRVRSVNLSFPDPFSSPLTTNTTPTYFTDNYNHSPSLVQRVRSMNFSFSSRSAEKPSPFPSLDQDEQQPHNDVIETETPTTHEEEEDLQCHVSRSKSATCVETSTIKKELMQLAADEKEKEKQEVEVRRRPVTVRERKEDEAVDRKADDFISKFREQLKMQRVDSILRYKEMLNRGVSI